jgi:hypothetical protein
LRIGESVAADSLAHRWLATKANGELINFFRIAQTKGAVFWILCGQGETTSCTHTPVKPHPCKTAKNRFEWHHRIELSRRQRFRIRIILRRSDNLRVFLGAWYHEDSLGEILIDSTISRKSPANFGFCWVILKNRLFHYFHSDLSRRSTTVTMTRVDCHNFIVDKIFLSWYKYRMVRDLYSLTRDKPLHWVSSSKKDYQSFPKEVQDDMGYALGVAQLGGKHPHAKAWKGEGPGIMEIVERFSRRHLPRGLYGQISWGDLRSACVSEEVKNRNKDAARRR